MREKLIDLEWPWLFTTIVRLLERGCNLSQASRKSCRGIVVDGAKHPPRVEEPYEPFVVDIDTKARLGFYGGEVVTLYC